MRLWVDPHYRNSVKRKILKRYYRRSIDDLFHQHVQMGNLQEALKLYGRGMREYCTAPNYVIQVQFWIVTLS